MPEVGTSCPAPRPRRASGASGESTNPPPGEGRAEQDGQRIGRPNPAQWSWYAIGGRLPARYREWVLYDVSGPTWVARHFSRAAVQIFPVFLVFLAPGPPWIKGVAILGGILMGLFYSLAYMDETCENRAIKHGCPRGVRRTIIQKRIKAANAKRTAQRRAKAAARRAAR